MAASHLGNVCPLVLYIQLLSVGLVGKLLGNVSFLKAVVSSVFVEVVV